MLSITGVSPAELDREVDGHVEIVRRRHEADEAVQREDVEVERHLLEADAAAAGPSGCPSRCRTTTVGGVDGRMTIATCCGSSCKAERLRGRRQEPERPRREQRDGSRRDADAEQAAVVEPVERVVGEPLVERDAHVRPRQRRRPVGHACWPRSSSGMGMPVGSGKLESGTHLERGFGSAPPNMPDGRAAVDRIEVAPGERHRWGRWCSCPARPPRRGSRARRGCPARCSGASVPRFMCPSVPMRMEAQALVGSLL